MKRPSVSVVIPVFNRPELLWRAVTSVFEQSFSDYELIVVDDASEWDMSSVENRIVRFGHRFCRIARGGVSRARNHGVALSRGKWVAFLDSDDLWLRDKLMRQVEFFANNPAFKLCQTEERWIRNGNFVNPKKRHRKLQGYNFPKALELCCISPSSVMLERDLLLAHGAFDERLRVCEDYDLWLRLCLDHPVGLLAQVLVEKYGGHSDQLSRSEPAMDRFRLYALLKLILSGRLVNSELDLVVTAAKRKALLLSAGAKKRAKERFAGLCCSIADALGAPLCHESLKGLYASLSEFI